MKPGGSGLRSVLRSVCRVIRHSRAILPGVRAHASSDLHDLGVDRCDPMILGHGYAVVAVPDEVLLADLVETHRRQLHSPVIGAVYTAPPLTHAHLAGQERPVEVPASSDAPRYLLDLYGFHPLVGLAPLHQGALGLLE